MGNRTTLKVEDNMVIRNSEAAPGSVQRSSLDDKNKDTHDVRAMGVLRVVTLLCCRQTADTESGRQSAS
jgi:hypothetical protein